MELLGIAESASRELAQSHRASALENNASFASEGILQKRRNNKKYHVHEMDMQAYELVKHMHHTNPYAQMAADGITSEVFKESMHATRGTEPIKVNYSLEQYLNTYMRPFLLDCFDMILTLGIVPYMINKRKLPNGGTVLVPEVPKIDFRLAIVLHLKKYTVEYVFIPIVPNNVVRVKEDPAVRFLTNFGHNPTPSGKLTSMIASGLSTAVFVNMINNYALEAEAERSNPRLVTETEKVITGNAELDALGGQHAFYQDRDLSEKRAEDQFEISQLSALMGRLQYLTYQNDVKQMLGRGADNTRGRSLGDSREKQLPFVLPQGQKVVNTHLPEARRDLPVFQTFLQDVIFALYGYPRTSVMESTHGRITQDSNRDALSRTVMKWKRILSDIATDVYDIAYGKSEFLQQVRENGESDPKNILKMDKEALAEARSESKLRFSLPITTNESSTVLYDKYLKEVISHEEMINFLRRQSGLPSARKSDMSDMFSRSQKRAMVEAMYVSAKKDDTKTSNDTASNGSAAATTGSGTGGTNTQASKKQRTSS